MCNAAMEEGNPQVILNNYAVFTYYVNTLTYRRKTDTDTAVKPGGETSKIRSKSAIYKMCWAANEGKLVLASHD